MRLPVPIMKGVEEALPGARLGSRVESAVPLGGGCINHGARLHTDTGAVAFLKWNARSPEGMFAAEAQGLQSLRACDALRVPAPLAWSTSEAGGLSWILLEHIAPGPRSQEVDRRLGEGLARLHSPRPGSSFGWPHDNWIGSLPQTNTPEASWPSFWRDLRFAPQLARARGRGRLPDEIFDHVVDVIPAALVDVTTACLIHGDLWAGNTFASASGEAVVIDPATYMGHGEVDLAMTELFGGFGPSFYAAYDSERPISSEYHAYRRDLYQLYYLLVHVNLFGSAYETGCLRAAELVVKQLK